MPCRSATARACASVRDAIATISDLRFDTLALAGLMLIAMTIAVTRFRRTLD